MERRVFRSLKSRLLASVIMLVMLLVSAFALVSYHQLEAGFLREIESDAESISAPFMDSIRDELPADDENVLLYLRVSVKVKSATILRELADYHQNLLYVSFADSLGLVFSTLSENHPLDSRWVPADFLQTRVVVSETDDAVVAKVPLVFEGNTLGVLNLYFSPEPISQRRKDLILTASLMLILFLGLGALGALFVGNRMAEPLHRFAEAISEDASIDPKEWRRYGSELELLSKRYVEMREGLQQSYTQLLSEKQKTDLANTAKSEFLQNVSHELRTPLNAIIGMSEMMRLKTFGDIGNLKYENYVEDIYDSGRFLLSILNDIIDISRIESGYLDVFQEKIDVKECLDQSVYMLSGALKSKHINASVEVVPRNLAVVTDRRRLQQVLINLLSNSIKFSNDGGRILLSAEMEGDDTRFSVSDFGIGIGPEDLKTIFDPFRRGSFSTIRDHEGAGLGLSIVKSIIEELDGRIDIESVVGEGTTVAIRLPGGSTVGPEGEANKQAIELGKTLH